MADLITRLLLNTQQFDNNLGKSTKQIRGFQNNIKNFSAGSVAAIGKFAGALGIAYGATEILQKGLNSNAKLQAEYNSYMEAASTVTNDFFSALYDGDWSKFNDGILEAIKNAKEYAKEYSNIMKMLEVTSARYERVDAEKNRLESIIEDESKSLTERKKAQAELDRLLIMGIADIREDAANVEKLLKEKLSNSGVTGNIDDAQRLIEELYDPTSSLRKRVDQFDNLKKQASNKSADDISGWVEFSKKYTDEQIKLFTSYSKIIKQLTDENYNKLKELFDKRSDLVDKAGTWQKDRTGARDEIKDTEKELAKSAKSGTKTGIKEASKEVKVEAINVPIRLLSESDFGNNTQINQRVKDDIESGKLKISAITPETVNLNYTYADSLNAIASVMGSITNLTSDGAAAWIAYGTNIVSSIATALPMITSLTTALTAKAAAEAAGSAAAVPVVGWINAIAAVGAIVAAMASVPKFATGGIVDGSSFYGDKVLARVNSGEMILNRSQQRNLFNLINTDVSGGSKVEFKIQGKDLVGVLGSYNNKTSKYK